jgi:hypothetical protein
MLSKLLQLLALLGAAVVLCGFSDLNRDQLKLLQDPAGWEYIKMTSSGMQTEHTCFDGKPHPETCSGRLTLSTDNTFVQEVTIQGQRVPRHGTYTLEGDQLTFIDELEQSDGPYTIEVDTDKKSLAMYMPQVRIELISEKALRDRKRKDAK